MTSYVCLLAGEWKNLCSMGRIRLHEARAIAASDQFSPDWFHALFSMAPEKFSLEETSDFLITEYINLQPKIDGICPPGCERGVQWLLLEDVVRFFPLRTADAWVFESDAQKAQVVLGEPAFESYWGQWFKAQVVDQACINGLALMQTLCLRRSPIADESELAQWHAAAKRIVDPASSGTDGTGFPTNLIQNRDRLFNLIIEDSDSASIFVSCPIEWMNLRSHANVLESDADLAEQAHRLHEKYWKMPFEPSLACADDLTNFATLLRARAPDAFPGVWTPAIVTLYVRYSHRIKFGSVSPDDIVAAVRAIETRDDRRTAELLAFLLGVALGSNKTHDLLRLLHRERFKVAAPQPANSQEASALTEPALIAEVAPDHASEQPTIQKPTMRHEDLDGPASAAPESNLTPEMPSRPELLQPPSA